MYLSATRRGLAVSWPRRRGMGVVSTPVNGTLVFGSNPVGGPIPVRRIWGGSPARPVGPAYPVSSLPPSQICPAWGCGGTPVNPVGPAYLQTTGPVGPITPVYDQPPNYSGSGSPYYSGGYPGYGGYGSGGQNNSQLNAQALAVAQALLATNPSLLTQQQYTMLQQAGLVAGTLPYSSVSQITPATPVSTVASAVNDPNCVAAGCTGGPYPNCTCAATATSGAATATSGIGATLSETFAGLPLYLWLIIGGGAAFMFSRSGGRR